ncbi:MAG: Dabb family protein [Gemmatimonadales bacterium]
MILHLVLFRLKPDTPPARLAEVERAILAMKERIPEIRDIKWGPNLGPSAGEYTHIAVVTCDDMAAVQRYLDHPVHKETVQRYIHPIREGRIAADVYVGEK